ncbi:MAG: efflux RND transporter periplasmic adaptor subunit [Pseudomonadota bacterium]|nr:efflux RND transporter periplasmic adaptor subunit [Pseudomonadota bacterium]
MRVFLQRFAGAIQISLIVLVLVVTFIVTRAPSEQTVSSGVRAEDISEEKRSVFVTKPDISNHTPLIMASGSMQVQSYVTMSSEVSGRVIQLSEALRAGGRFSAGEVLLKIDPADFELRLEQAIADVASAEATLKLRIAESNAARENYALLHRGKPVPELVAKEPQKSQAMAQLDSAIAREKIAALALSRTEFSLPFAGYVTETSASLGQLLAPGQIFGRAFADSSVEAKVTITAEELAIISPLKGRSAKLFADDRDYKASVDRASAELDSKTRFAQIFLKVEENIPPGTFISVEIEGAPQKNTMSLPLSARKENDSVWIVSNGFLQKVKLDVLSARSDTIIVKAFNYQEGIVQSNVPWARNGLAVAVLRNKQ